MKEKFLIHNVSCNKYMGLTENGNPFWTSKKNASILCISPKTKYQEIKGIIAEIWKKVDKDISKSSNIKLEKKED